MLSIHSCCSNGSIDNRTPFNSGFFSMNTRSDLEWTFFSAFTYMGIIRLSVWIMKSTSTCESLEE